MQIDTKVLAELVKPFNGIALNVFIISMQENPLIFS